MDRDQLLADAEYFEERRKHMGLVSATAAQAKLQEFASRDVQSRTAKDEQHMIRFRAIVADEERLARVVRILRALAEIGGLEAFLAQVERQS